MSDFPIRVAHRETIVGLLSQIPSEDTLPESDDTSFPHLRWMMNRCLEHLFTWPIDKISRWVGCVQGVMRCRGVLDFSAERDRTRPIFHRAYEATGQIIPETANRVVDVDWSKAQRIDDLTQTLDKVLSGEKVRNVVVGEVMRELHGSANPAEIQTVLNERLAR